MTWRGLGGELVFDMTINRDPSDGVPSEARIYCQSSPQDEQVVTISEAQSTQLDVEFRSGCRVVGWLRQRAHVQIHGVAHTGIFANIYFGPNNEDNFEGLMAACPSGGSPEPGPSTPSDPLAPPASLAPMIEDPTEPGSPLPIVSGRPDDSFNYVHVRRWPRVTDADLRFGFIQYQSSSPPSSAFFNDLGQACEQGRSAAETLAVSFINGDAPYQGIFVGSVASLEGPLREFADLADNIQGFPQGWLQQLGERLETLLERYGESTSYFSSASYHRDLDRIWQSYFALVVTLGYDWALLNDLAQSIWLAHLIEANVTQDPAGDMVVGERAPRELAELANARVLLPASVFPLPAATAGPASPPQASDAGWIEPYAIGDLQLVRQRLVHYSPGEIARIENVMRGERREISRRHVQRRVDVQEKQGSEELLLQNDDADERSSLLDETRKMVAEETVANNYDNFKTSYGPPTQTTLDGSWTRATTQGPKAGREDVTRFARDILNKTVNRIRRTVGMVRTSGSMNQVEDVVTSVIDNTSGHTSIRAVFRWLNKVYEASVVNYGNRLMLEFYVRRPAAPYIARETALTGQRLARPVPPAQLGVHSFKDIGPENYADLGARYGVTELEPPPLANKFVTATLRSGEEQQIAVPTGYCAIKAFVSCAASPPDSPAPLVLVGRQPFNAGTDSAPLPSYGEDSAIPVSVAGIEHSLSSPTEAQVLVNVEVQCEPTVRAMDEWRISIYRAMIQSHRQQATDYYGEFGLGGGRRMATRSPLANRQIEQRELEKACIRLLLERVALLTGTADPGETSSPPASPSPWLVNEPRYVQFLGEALEWTEMAYSFHVSPRGQFDPRLGESGTPDADDDPLFTSFLQAEHARILLPVQPGRVMAFLYAFSSGMLWDGMDRLVPALTRDLALVNDLEHAARDEHTGQKVGPAWEIVVPTSMQVLDEAIFATTDAAAITLERPRP